MVVPPPSAPTSSSSYESLAYESLKTMRGQIVADFIVEHRINDEHDLEVGYITCHHGSCSLMDRLVMMNKGLVPF